MSIVLQIFVIALCLAFLIFVVKLIASERFLLKYSLLWIIITLVILLCACFPQPLFALASLLGFKAASNLVFLIAIFFLIAICLSLSSIASKQTLKIKNLIQQQALLEHRLDELEKSMSVKNDCQNN